ncbi:MAG: antibiotic biosynthesis monooxygenase [Desulfobacteraceae bacterium]|nr:antibiotic biosynthesis monooxygenase [Desulfobacteraceae bacterium]
MIVKVFIKRKVRQESLMDAFHLLKNLRYKAMNYQGYISGETLVNAENESELMVVSTWYSMQDWNNWKQSEDRITIDAQLEGMQLKPTEYEPFVFSKYRLAVKTGVSRDL